MMRRILLLAAIAVGISQLAAIEAQALDAELLPQISGGLSISSTLIPNNATPIIVKASAGQVYHLTASNNSANLAYINFFNIAAGGTCGSTASVDRYQIPIAAAGGMLNIDFPYGIPYGTGIAYCVHTVYGDADATAPAASAYIVNVYYK